MLRTFSRALVGSSRPLRFFHSGLLAQRRLTEVVPALGESITEGTIAKWAKAEGDNVNADDVVVVVETDKVTVDIKANFRGVVVKHLAKENVEVGKPLYEIEVDESAAASAPAAASTAATSAPSSSSSNAAAASSSKASGHRKPLIRFIGKRSLQPNHHSPLPPLASQTKAATAASQSNLSTSPSSGWPAPKKPQTGVDFFTLKDAAFYGRPKLSAKEIAAIESGGAY